MVKFLNFAGGEPLLFPHFFDVFEYAYKKGFTLSIITNGYFLKNPESIPSRFFQKLSMLGISVDSTNEDALKEMGRCDKRGNVLSLAELKHIILSAKKANPSIRIKLNTTVCKCNKDEHLTAKLSNLPIRRWKFLKMKPFQYKGFSNYDISVSEAEFKRFVRNNPIQVPEKVIEDNLESSYVFIDNAGNLLDNSEENGYKIVGNLLEEDFQSIMERYSLDRSLYFSRYQ